MDMQILAEKFYDYSAFSRGYSKMTVRRYWAAINLYRNRAGIIKIEEICEENIRLSFFHGRTERDWKPTTYATLHVSLSVFFQWCIREGCLKHNPIEAIEVPKPDKRLPSHLTKQDALKLLDVILNYPYESHFLQYRTHAIFSTFIFAGLRKQELLNLRCVDVDTCNKPCRME